MAVKASLTTLARSQLKKTKAVQSKQLQGRWGSKWDAKLNKEGRTHGQVGQQPYMMGYKAMYVLKDIVDGKALKFDNPSLKAIYTGLDVCMKPNIGSCIAG